MSSTCDACGRPKWRPGVEGVTVRNCPGDTTISCLMQREINVLRGQISEKAELTIQREHSHARPDGEDWRDLQPNTVATNISGSVVVFGSETIGGVLAQVATVLADIVLEPIPEPPAPMSEPCLRCGRPGQRYLDADGRMKNRIHFKNNTDIKPCLG